MSSHRSILRKVAALGSVLVLAACAGGGSSAPLTGSPVASDTSSLRPLSGKAAGGGPQIPPPQTVDGPALFVYNASAVNGTPIPSVDFDALQNTVQGGISIGASRTAQVIVYNISKKTPLAFTAIEVVGTNAADFAVTPANVQLALSAPLPARQGSAVILPVTFTPSGEGARTAVLRIKSNAATAKIPLSGTGLSPLPILVTAAGPLSFLPASAPDTVAISNSGGTALALQSITIGGANPGSFGFTVANHGFSNCFAGVLIGPHATCFVGVGLAPGATAPSNAILAIVSNDPVHPETDIPLTLTP
jgi:hypothetical protein